MIIGREVIESVRDLKTAIVDVPEWGEDAQVIVTELSAHDRLKFSEALESEENKEQLYVALALTWFVVDGDGVRIFTDADAHILAAKSPVVLCRIFEKAQEINKLGGEVEAEAKK